MHFLTAKQQRVLDVIVGYNDRFGYSPTLSELMKELKISTKRGVVQYLETLEKKGKIVRTADARGIRLMNEDFETNLFLNIPVLGFANAGDPLVEAVEDNMGTISVDKRLLPNKRDLFGIYISGDSMNRQDVAGTVMENGRIAIVSRDLQPKDLDVVLAVVENQATVKKFRKTANAVILSPNSTNPIHNPIYLYPEDSNYYINGVVVRILDSV